MANNCFNWAHIVGSKESLDLLEARLIESKKETPHLWYGTFHQVLGIEVPENGDTYASFGTNHHPSSSVNCLMYISWQLNPNTKNRDVTLVDTTIVVMAR